MEGAISFIFERKVAINFYFTDATDENCFAVSTFFENRSLLYSYCSFSNLESRGVILIHLVISYKTIWILQSHQYAVLFC